jgi:hypothetical protein
MAEPKASVILELIDRVTKPVDGARGALGKFGDAITSTAAKVAAFAVAAALGAFFKSAIEEAMKAEQSTIRLGNAVKNAGAKFEDWAPQIDATVNKLTKLTTYSDDDLSSALGTLITKTGDVAGSLKNMGLVTDLAANKNISLEEAATQVAKAINGGGRLFKEYGIEVGTSAEKTAQLAAVLSGSAAKAADSFGGRLSNLGKAWGELKEDTGKAIISNAAIGDALASLASLVDTLSPKIARFVAFIVGDVVTSITRFVDGMQTFGSALALGVLELPERFKLAWGKLMLAISGSIADSRVLMTVFGDGLTKIADKMGVSGARMVRESSVNLHNLKVGFGEVMGEVEARHAKGETDRTASTVKGTAARLDAEEKGAKAAKEVWTGSANVFKDSERQRAEAADRANSVIRQTWGLSSDYIIKEANKVIAVHRIEAAALGTIIDGMDGVYGSSVAAAPKVEAVGSELYNAARGAISLGREFGTIDDEAASVLGNVVNLADALKDGFTGISSGNLIGAVGALAGILGTVFGDSPEAKARKEALAKNTQRLQELRDRMGELLNISTPGGKLAALQGINVNELQGATQLTSGWGAGNRLNIGKVGQFLAQRGVSLTDFRQLASDSDISLNEEKGTFSAEMVRQLFTLLNSQQLTGFSNDLSGLIGRQDFIAGISGSGPGDQLAGLASALSSGSGSSALGGLFSGINLGDGTDAAEAADIRQRAMMLAARYAGGGVSAGEMGGASNSVFMTLLERIIAALNDIASTNAATAGATAATADAVSDGGLGRVVDTQLAATRDFSRLSQGMT